MTSNVELHARHLARLVTIHEEGQIEGHSERTEAVMRAVLTVLGEVHDLPEEARSWPLAMLPHDLGKLVIPAEVLRKTTKINAYERGLIVLHTLEGQDQISWLAEQAAYQGNHSTTRFWQLAALIAGGHHERPDGAGYPLGLGGEAVPPVLRVARLVDVYEALTARRAYRDSMSHEQAIRVMKYEEGGFDEDLLEALEEAMARKRAVAG